MATGLEETTLIQKEDSVTDSEWQHVRDRLRETYGEAVFKSWLNPIRFDGISNGQAVLTVPTRFMREWINANYLDTLKRYWNTENKRVYSVNVMVRQEMNKAAESQLADNEVISIVPAAPVVASPVANFTAPSRETEASTAPMSSPLDPRFTFENFVVGKPNELAFAAARRVSESVSIVPGCNPLFLYGGVGLGKTHLMHAVAWHILRTNPERKVMYLSAEKFMYQFIRALRFNQAIAFKEQFRSVDVLMIDDVQFISGKDSTQEEFFHTFNALIDQNKQLIISADRSPSDLEGIEERIRSRLGWGLVADLHATSYELRLGILQTKVEKLRDVFIPPVVLEFLARKITSNIRELEGALNRVVAHATLVGAPVTLESTQDVLKDLLRANDKRISIEDIQKSVAEFFHIKVSDMHSARRSVAVARPRQIAMYISKQLTTRSLPEIGRKFGGKDHTTVMHAVKRIEELMQQDAELKNDVELLKRMLQS